MRKRLPGTIKTMTAQNARIGTTMADVAAVAGVSVSTVSHVINGTRRVSEAAAQAVRSAIETTGYTHDHVARSLATGRTATIGLAMSALSNPYFSEAAHSIEQAASRAGYSLLLADTHDNPDDELRAVKDILGRRVDGVILAPSADPIMTLDMLKSRRIPTVVVDRFVSAEVDQIATENIVPTMELVRHLTDLGHTRIGMVAGLQGLSTSEERLEGYRLGLEAADIAYADELIVRGDSDDVGAETVLPRLLQLDDPPTALVVSNNKMTIGVMRGLRAARIKVPEDIALVAFDDFEWADLFHPRLTTIAQATGQIGREAVSMLLSRLNDPTIATRQVRLQPRFVHRDSCGCQS